MPERNERMGRWYRENHKVEFNECDLSGTVYNSKYFIWFERARFQIAKEAGLQELVEKYHREDIDQLVFPVLEAESKFTLPIPIGANISIRTKLERPKVAKLIFHHIVTDLDSGKEYAKAKTVVGILSSEKGLLWYLSDDMKQLIDNYLEGGI